VKILVVEDDSVLGEALTGHLCRSGIEPTLIQDGANADHLLATQSFDLLVLDLGLPIIAGFEVLRRVRKRGDRLPVLILTARDELQDRVRGFELGADDYLCKPFAMAELALRIKALLRRAYRVDDEVLEVGRLRLDALARRVTIDKIPAELSPREFDVLEILMLRESRVVSREDLMQRLYDSDSEVGPNAVDVFMSRIRRKIGGSGVVIRTIRGLGYLLEPDPHAQT
jgi:DNA-binding response OmpR family regulator